MMPRKRPPLTLSYAAELQCVDLVHPDDNEPFPIMACLDCLPWHAEIILTGHPQCRVAVVREWHAVACPTLDRELRFVREELHGDGCPDIESDAGCPACSPSAHHRKPPRQKDDQPLPVGAYDPNTGRYNPGP